MRYLASITYDGSSFYGFEKQPRKRTIQGEIEKVLTKINKTKVIIKGAGRTDRGVHAYDQHIHFDLNQEVPIERLINAINDMLPSDIKFNYIKEVDNNFHARFDVKSKTYVYIINIGKYDVMKDKYLYNYCNKLNISAMKRASKYLIGAHDFESFVSGDRESFNSIINKISIIKKKDLIIFTFTGKSFYRYMVRNLVGALLLVGKNKIKDKDMKTLLEAKKNIYNYMTVPANGLYLKKIEY